MKKIFIASTFILFVTIVQAQNVGIGVPVPLQKLDVNGAIRLGNTGTNNTGTLRFNSGRFEGYDGLSWNWLNGFKLPLDTSVSVADGYVLNIYNNNFLAPQSSAIAGFTSSSNGIGLYGENNYSFSGFSGIGVFGKAAGSGTGVSGTNLSGTGNGVSGTSVNGYGVVAVGGTGGVFASSDLANGVEAQTKFGIAIKGTASAFSGIGLDISASNSASSTAAIFRHPIINGKALIVEKGFVGIGESDPIALLSVKGNEATGSGLAAAISLQNAASSNKWYIRAGGPGTITPNGGLSIADNTDYRLVIGATGNIGITGFTQLGKTAEGAPVIKMKKLSTTSAALQTGSVTIAHGLTRSKILSVQVLLTYLANAADIPASYLDVPGYEYNWQVNNNDVWIINKNGNSANILSKPIRILITYEE